MKKEFDTIAQGSDKTSELDTTDITMDLANKGDANFFKSSQPIQHVSTTYSQDDTIEITVNRN